MLIVEDDSYISRLYKIILKLAGHRIVGIANNGECAIELYKSISEKPDIILMDHRMPIKNGIDTTKKILEINKKAKIIFISADDSIENLALSLGAFCFITKPFKFEDLLESIDNAMKNPHLTA